MSTGFDGTQEEEFAANPATMQGSKFDENHSMFAHVCLKFCTLGKHRANIREKLRHLAHNIMRTVG